MLKRGTRLILEGMLVIEASLHAPRDEAAMKEHFRVLAMESDSWRRKVADLLAEDDADNERRDDALARKVL